MEKQFLTKEKAQKLMTIKGEVRGVVFKTDGDYILLKKGEEGLQKIEQELKELGYPIKYKEIKTMAFYPVGLRALSLLAIKKVFGFNDAEIEEMGSFATKTSLLIRLFTKYIFSPSSAFYRQGTEIWKRHWTVGQLIPAEFNEEKKYAVIQLKDFDLHPVYCCYLKGYLPRLIRAMIKTEKITCQETKCTFLGDDYHQFLIKWQ